MPVLHSMAEHESRADDRLPNRVGIHETARHQCRHLGPERGARQGGGIDQCLARLHPRLMGIAEHGEPVGLQRDRGVERA